MKGAGLLGGTFDPVHNGHLAIAGEAMARLELEKVVFMPTCVTPLKEENCITATQHRVRMVELAIAGHPYFSMSTIEMDREGVSYTVDTVSRLVESAGRRGEIYFIMGCDSLASLPRWKEPERLIRMCRLVAVPRPGCDVPDLEKLEREIPGLVSRVIVMEGPYLDISSTEIRERVAAGRTISHLVPLPVEEYIRENGLYLKK
jgi:nicotinate-nucleotide adenylyltransferase